MFHRLPLWLAWRGLQWNRLSAKRRVAELAAMHAYYDANQPIRWCKAKYLPK